MGAGDGPLGRCGNVARVRRLVCTLAVAALAACSGETSLGGAAGATEASGDGTGSTASPTDAAAGTGATGTTGTAGPPSTAGTTGTSPDTTGNDATSGGATDTTGDSCDGAAGTHGCPCADGACIGDLICGAGDLCYEPDECQGDPGSPWCPCVAGECLAGMDLICVDGVCVVDECPGADKETDPNNCGGCGNTCTIVAGVGGCVGGVCQASWGECIDQWPEPAFVDCDDYCGSIGLTCAAAVCDEDWNCTPGQCDGNGQYYFEDGWCESLSGGYPSNGTCDYPLALPEGSTKYDSQVRCCCR